MTVTKNRTIFQNKSNHSKSYYDKSAKFSGSDTDDLESKLAKFRSYLNLHSVSSSVWVQAFPIMLSDHAQPFFETTVEPHYDLETMPYEHLLTIFRKKYNTPQRNLRLMDEWNSISFSKIATIHPNATLKHRTDQLFQTLSRLRLYLKNEISDFQHK